MNDWLFHTCWATTWFALIGFLQIARWVMRLAGAGMDRMRGAR